MNEPPDHTAELRAANLLSLGGMIVPNQRLHELGVLAHGGVHVAEQHALRLEVGPVAVEDDFALVLGGDTGQVLALGLGDAELLVGRLDGVGQVVPVLDLILGRLHVVVDVVEVEVGHVHREPRRHRPGHEPLQGLQPELEHPLGLALHGRHLADDLLGEALLRLEDVVLGVAPAELVPAEIEIRVVMVTSPLDRLRSGTARRPLRAAGGFLLSG